MTAMTEKKKAKHTEEQVEAIDKFLDGEISAEEAVKLHAVADDKPEPRPGEKGFDWQTEYPGEEFWVYTVPDDAKMSPNGKQSPPGLTIGLAKLSEDRAPNPGEMDEAYEVGGFAPMWVMLRAVVSPAARKLIKLLRPPEYNAMLRGWAKFAGIELSE